MTSTPRHRDRDSRENHGPKLPREDRSSSASQDSGTRVSWGPLLNPRPAPHRCLPSVGLSTVPLRWPPRAWRAWGAAWRPWTHRLVQCSKRPIASSRFSAARLPACSHGKLWLTWGGKPAVDTWLWIPDHSPEVPPPRAECAPGAQVTFRVSPLSRMEFSSHFPVILAPSASELTGASAFSVRRCNPCLTV